METPEVLTAREALFAIRLAVQDVNQGAGNAREIMRAGLDEVSQLAVEGLRHTGMVNFELSDQLADRLAEAHKVLRELREGGGDVADLSGEIDEALALPPDLEAMVDRRLPR